jgi:hypothetical protein
MGNFSVFDLDDRTEAIVVLHACCEDGPVDFIFDDSDTAAVCLVSNQLIGRLKRNVIAVAPESVHQIGASSDNARPTRKVVQDFVDDVVTDDVKEVLAIDKVA